MSNPNAGRESSLAALSLAALGVVYGDIGTSPLYTLKECLDGHTPLEIIPENVYGMLSLIFWGLMLVVSLKYVFIILRADNRGEGGVLSLMALALQKATPGSKKALVIAAAGIFGAALFYGDSMITPAISVLSALEGVGVVSHKLDPYIVPMTIAVLIALFAIQSRGTATVGKLFGPVMMLWFAVLGVLGLLQIIKNPAVLAAMSPVYAFRFAEYHSVQAFVLLGAVVLALTGAEALYADMGHFGRPAIRRAWFGFVLPSLVLNYFGQGALLLADPKTIKNPFFLLAPDWALVPLVVLATLATVIASQAVISGAFSMTKQAVQLGFCPRMNIEHTSETEIGQIYLPQVNWMLLISVILLVLAFRSSANLASAYGFAVTCTMVVTTLLAFMVLGRTLTRAKRVVLWIVLSFLFMIDLLLFSANVLKIPDGGWFPLVIGMIAFTVMMTWHRGRALLGDKLHEGELPLSGFVESLESGPPQRVEGVAVFMTGSTDSVPHALLHNLKHNKVLHEQVVFLTVSTADIPFVPRKERVVIRKLGKTFHQIIATYGFKEEPQVPEILAQVEELQPDLRFDPMETSYFLSRETIVQGKHPAISRWRGWLFSIMARNSVRATQYFKIPPNRVVEMGTQVEL
ncbi:KUP system potassium uptake protein [Andreprevotia lacus DSM 23236]|jgi:KUP system potassium uptake protein|uniref:Probable potassium transport system protein Kup n=1 Tax=Andreprevotia lacus DSM 23236 TaxID=1121001 RepID=A0A1W1Y0S0_9NEIS|nr:potassium transporter Kup [Andreprevotia lacus]SMC29724.1 KUP system potassium uptake protein [Andreprevotia lacus DSM 23236]